MSPPRLRRTGAWLVIGLLGLTVAASSVRAQLAAAPTIHSVRDFWLAAQGAAATAPHPVEMEFVVEYYDPAWNLLWVQSSGRIDFLPNGKAPLPVHSRQRVKVSGMIVPAHGVERDQVTVQILEETVPTPAPKGNGRLTEVVTQREPSTWLRAYVERQEGVDRNHLAFDLVVDDRRVSGRLWLADGELAPNFAEQWIELEGICVSPSNLTSKADDLQVWIRGSGDVQVAGGLSVAEQYAIPLSRVGELSGVAAETGVRVAGQVVAYEPGRRLAVRDETGLIELPTPIALDVKPGDHVEVLGRPVQRAGVWTLREIVFRRQATPHPAGAEPPADRGLVTLRLAEQALHLMPEEAARGFPVELTGVVTFSHPLHPVFFLNDSSGGLCVKYEHTNLPRPDVGQVVALEGHTVVGGFATLVQATHLKVIGQEALPATRPVTLEHALTGVEDAQWVEMRGFLRQIEMLNGLACMTVVASAGEFVMCVPANSPPPITLGSVLRARGVCGSMPNEKRQLMAINLLVPSLQEVVIDDAAPADPFSRPLRNIASLRQYQPAQTLDRQVRVHGVVIQHIPGRLLLVAGDGEVLRVLSRDTTALTPGDVVDIVGLPGRLAAQLVLREAVYRRTKHGPEPASLELPESVAFDPELDARLVRIRGRILDLGVHEDETRLFVQTGTTVCEVRLTGAPSAGQLGLWQAGSEVTLTGVYRVQFDEYDAPEGFIVQLRAAADLVVQGRPSWWTARRALTIAGVFFGMHLLGLVWAGTLRRRVHGQTNVIRAQLEKESHLEARFRDIVENASDFILSVDLNGRFTSFNPAGEQLTGYPRSVALRLTMYDLLDPRDARLVRWTLTRPEGRKDLIGFQTRVRRRDGSSVWVEASARFIRQNGRVTGVLGVVRDISARKQVEEELKLARDAAEANTRAKSLFLANMSHEIRTPMNGVIGMSHLLLDTRLDEQQRDFAETIRNSAESLLTVLNDILDFSKIEAGKLQFEHLDFPLGETVDDALELLAGRAAAKNLELAAFLPHDLPARLRGDPGRLRQVLLNLVGNAVKFTARGEVVVRVTREAEDEAHLMLRFEIADTGVGIAPEAQKNLFQAFHQADNSMTRKFGGTGLGLVISKQIAELMHGQIGVTSTLGQGSTFWFTTRLEKVAATSVVPPPGEDNDAAWAGWRVLVVDDNAVNRKLVQHFLEPRGLRVAPAANATEGLALAHAAIERGEPFQVFLLDLQMPDMDGLSLARVLHADPRLADVPIVLLASLDRPITADLRQGTGVVACLTKPLRQAELLRVLHRYARSAGVAPVGGLEIANPAAVPAGPARPGGAGALSGLRVLVAEDNVVNQRLTCLQLKKLGLQADIAGDGREVLEAVERTRYDVILMDCQMPEIDGFEATRRLRGSGKFPTLRIVAMTANAMQGDRERCLEAGMDDYLSKPTRLDDLRAALQRCVAAPEPRRF